MKHFKRINLILAVLITTVLTGCGLLGLPTVDPTVSPSQKPVEGVHTTAPTATPAVQGQLNGVINRLNGGRAIQDGDYIYYTNVFDEDVLGTYRENLKTGEVIKFNEDTMSYMFIHGDWIFYSFYDFEKNDYASYRINKDGSQKIQMPHHQYGYILGDWMYYRTESSNPWFRNYLYKVRLDGSDLTQIKLNLDSSDPTPVEDDGLYCKSFFVYQDLFYYEADGDLHRFYPETGVSELITQKSFLKFFIENDHIYHISYLQGKMQICKFLLDGSQVEVLHEGIDIYTFNYKDGWLYFIESNALYRMRTDGSEKAKLQDSYVTGLSITQSSIFVDYKANAQSALTLHRMNLDGSDLRKVDSPQ